jgi:hypothetical protein
MTETNFDHGGHGAPHHEESDVDIRGVFRFAAWLFVLTVATGLVCWMLFRYFDSEAAEAGAARDFPLAAGRVDVPPEPRLQVTPRDDLQELRRQEDAILNTYTWVDRDAGIVRIPIEVAMRLTLERGLPARQAPPADAPPASPAAGGR